MDGVAMDSTFAALTPAEVTRYQALFSLYDEHGTGNITLEQLTSLLPHMGIFLNEEQVHGLLAVLDEDGSGELSFDEFAHLIVQQRQYLQLSLLSENRESFWYLKANTKLPGWAMWPDGWWRSLVDMLVLISLLIMMIDAGDALKDLLEDEPTEEIGYTNHTMFALRIVAGCVLFADIIVRLQEMNLPTYTQPAAMFAVDMRTTIHRNLFSPRIVVDLLGGLPLDFICELGEFDELRVTFQTLRLLKAFRVDSFFRTCGRTLVTPAYVTFHYTVAPLMKLGFKSLLMMHILSTVFLLLHQIHPDPQDRPLPTYIHTLHHVVQMVSGVGLTEQKDFVVTTPAFVFNLLLALVQCIFVGVVIGKVAQMMQRADINSNMQERILETVSVLHHLDIPDHFRQEILGYQSFHLESSHQVFDAALECLPDMIKDRMVLYARMKVMRNIMPCPNAVPELSIARLAQALVSLTVPPDEYVIVAGEEANEVFFLVHGMCCVLTTQGDRVAVIKRGRVFGEGSLLTAQAKKKAQEAERSSAGDTPGSPLSAGERASNVKSLTYCKLYRLDWEVVAEVSIEFPMIIEQLGLSGNARRGPGQFPCPTGRSSTRASLHTPPRSRKNGGKIGARTSLPATLETENTTHSVLSPSISPLIPPGNKLVLSSATMSTIHGRTKSARELPSRQATTPPPHGIAGSIPHGLSTSISPRRRLSAAAGNAPKRSSAGGAALGGAAAGSGDEAHFRQPTSWSARAQRGTTEILSEANMPHSEACDTARSDALPAPDFPKEMSWTSAEGQARLAASLAGRHTPPPAGCATSMPNMGSLTTLLHAHAQAQGGVKEPPSPLRGGLTGKVSSGNQWQDSTPFLSAARGTPSSIRRRGASCIDSGHGASPGHTDAGSGMVDIILNAQVQQTRAVQKLLRDAAEEAAAREREHAAALRAVVERGQRELMEMVRAELTSIRAEPCPPGPDDFVHATSGSFSVVPKPTSPCDQRPQRWASTEIVPGGMGKPAGIASGPSSNAVTLNPTTAAAGGEPVAGGGGGAKMPRGVFSALSKQRAGLQQEPQLRSTGSISGSMLKLETQWAKLRASPKVGGGGHSPRNSERRTSRSPRATKDTQEGGKIPQQDKEREGTGGPSDVEGLV